MKKEEPFTLSEEEIIERLRTDDIAVINTIYDICHDSLSKEDDRSKVLDTKGATLLGISGLSSSVVFTLGGILIEKIENAPLAYIGCPIPWLVFFYVSSSITLLLSLLYALLSVKMRSDWRWLRDQDIFRQDMIEEGIGPYKRYMATHFWKIFQNNFEINERKGAILRRGHVLFFLALLQMLPIIIIIGLYAYERGGI